MKSIAWGKRGEGKRAEVKSLVHYASLMTKGEKK